MKLYLLACQTIQTYESRILPLLPEQRRLAYDRSRSELTLGAGLLLASLLGVHRDRELRMGPYGKPFLAAGRPEFSLSHSGKHVLLGISDGPIGVDMERSGRQVPPAVRERICLQVEKSLDPLVVFTRKECAMKLTGMGFTLPLSEIDATVDFLWREEAYHFYTAKQDGYTISVLTAEKALPEIQRLTPEELL